MVLGMWVVIFGLCVLFVFWCYLCYMRWCGTGVIGVMCCIVIICIVGICVSGVSVVTVIVFAVVSVLGLVLVLILLLCFFLITSGVVISVFSYVGDGALCCRPQCVTFRWC